MIYMKMLNRNQREELSIAYESARNCDSGESSRQGEHAILIATLTKFGFIVGSVMTAYEICEKILGW